MWRAVVHQSALNRTIGFLSSSRKAQKAVTSSSSDTLRFLPVGLDVQGKLCLVVGGGSVGTRKVTNLVGAGAMVTVVSPAVTDDLADQIKSGCVRWVQDSFQEEYLDGAFIVVAATADESLNARIVRYATECGALVCDASSSERSQLIFGALHKGENGVTIAVFTDGRDPAEARRTRDRIAGLVDQDRKQEEDRPGSD